MQQIIDIVYFGVVYQKTYLFTVEIISNQLYTWTDIAKTNSSAPYPCESIKNDFCTWTFIGDVLTDCFGRYSGPGELVDFDTLVEFLE